MTQIMEDQATTETDRYVREFGQFEKRPQPAWVLPLRKAAMSSFSQQGFPTLNDEDWRFTNVAPIAKLPFKPIFEAASNDRVA